MVCFLAGACALVFSGLSSPAAEMAEFTEDDPQILEMVTGFYHAVEEKNELFASRLAAPWSDDVRDALWKGAESLHHADVKTWSMQLDGNEYVAIVRYSGETEGDAPELGLVAMFLYEDEAGRLMIATEEDSEHDMYQKIGSVISTEPAKQLIAKAQEDYTADPAAREAAETEMPVPETSAPEPAAPASAAPASPTPAPAAPEPAALQAPETDAPVQSEYIFADSDSRYLTAEEINALSLQAMNYAKNEIFARRGRKFNSVELQQYFGSKSWYNGTIEAGAFSSSVFNEYEMRNSELISSLEKQRAGSESGYPLDQPGYDIHAVGTASLR